jgi:hypothetical protein
MVLIGQFVVFLVYVNLLIVWLDTVRLDWC